LTGQEVSSINSNSRSHGRNGGDLTWLLGGGGGCVRQDDRAGGTA